MKAKTSDPSFLTRGKLARIAQTALAEGHNAGAIEAYGAMIQKAKRLDHYDIEAEVQRFVTLYLLENFPAAVQRCVHCLDALKILGDRGEEVKELPLDATRELLERALLQTMVKRGDTFFAITHHLWKIHEGEYYLLKRPMGLFGALGNAWLATRNPFPIGREFLREELPLFTAYLMKIYEAAGDIPDSGEESGGGEAIAEKEASGEAAGTKAQEAGEVAFLVQLAGSPRLPEQLEPILEAAEHMKEEAGLAALARLVERLDSKGKMRVYAALRRNSFFTSKTRMSIHDPDALRLFRDLEAFYSE